jgi:hypothetical protein
LYQFIDSLSTTVYRQFIDSLSTVYRQFIDNSLSTVYRQQFIDSLSTVYRQFIDRTRDGNTLSISSSISKGKKAQVYEELD